MGEGCIEKFDAEFIRWILLDGRSRKTKQKFKDALENYTDKVIVIKNQRELTKLMKETEK